MKLRPGTSEEAGMSSERIARIREKARRWVEEEKLYPALAVLVARRGVIVLEEAFGKLTAADDSPPLRSDSIFPLVSLAKPIVATQAMILVEEGELGLNRPVQYYLPEFKGPGKEKVMVHQLLTHTSGLDDGELDAVAKERKGQIAIPPTPATQNPEVHENLFLKYDLPLSYEPGSEMRYCNHGYELMGEIVQRVSSQRLADFARIQLFEPLRMLDTYYIVPEDKRQRVVLRPPDYLGADFLNNREWQDAPWAAVGVLSSAKDMTIFGQMFLNGGAYGDARILSPVTVAEMTRNQIPGVSAELLEEYFPEAGWGLGWILHMNKQAAVYAETLPSAASYSHSGHGGTFFWVDPVQELVGCFFAVYKQWVNRNEWFHCMRLDLFINAVTAAIVE